MSNLLLRESLEFILETLYPHTPQAPFIDSTASTQPNDSSFSSRELRKVIRKFNKTKAPGYDGLDNIILQQIHSASPELLLEMSNKCLGLGLFPTSFLGKLLEKLMTQHLTYSLKKTWQVSPKQFGFKEGVSVDSLLTTIDNRHGLEISKEKSQLLLLSNLRRGPPIYWGSQRVKRTKTLKYLGVHLDSKLNCAHHLVQQGAKALQQPRQLVNLAECTMGISPKLPTQLYRAVTEGTVAYGVSTWGRYFTYCMITKLSQIQRPFLLNITRAYRTMPTAALQAITGIMPLDIKLEAEAQFVQMKSLKKNLTIEGEEYNYETCEEKATGWSRHQAEFTDEERENLEENLGTVGEINIFTYGSKMEQGVGSAFCVFGEQQELIAHWQGRLSPKDSIFQSALQEAVKYAQNHQNQVKIWSASQYSQKALLNHKSNSQIHSSFSIGEYYFVWFLGVWLDARWCLR
ncbi:hypothetical protein AVEN_78851-1 [Araneus ventricosus]|uniref:Reverse transcriptase domain-containing protein n=1 Tax=Araneus ventricosus TaxID=182803 RepID=A0A4Y2NY40_ARAVE|nr:hypothetical protein AVEN_78851-1 [Araneus ventricosus]